MARILVIGAGGLGCPALVALGEAGVEAIGLLEPDRVELSNLHRQILYGDADVGRPKADVAAEVMRARFPGTAIEARPIAFGAQTAQAIEDYDVVIDATDGFDTKLAISDAAVDRNIPYVFAGVVGFEGQVLAVRPGVSACLRCLFDEGPPPGAAPTCAEIGILGPIAGFAAAEQVRAALALLAGDATIVDRLWMYEGGADRVREVALRRAPDCRGCADHRLPRTGEVAEASVADHDAPELDLAGLVCPDTYIRTRKALHRLEPGGRLWVRLTSDESARNVPASAVAAGYRLLARQTEGQEGHRVLLGRPAERCAVGAEAGEPASSREPEVSSEQNPNRYARQIVSPGVGLDGQRALAEATVTVHGGDLAAELCARYLAGAGVGCVRVDARQVASAVAVNGDVSVVPARVEPALAVDVGDRRGGVGPGPSVFRAARAARWALVSILGERIQR